MKTFFYFALISLLAFAIVGCDDDKETVGPDVTDYDTYQSSNIKESAVYYSFDNEAQAHIWDVKFGAYGGFGSPEFYLNPTHLGTGHVMIYDTGMTDFAAVSELPDEAEMTTDPDTEITGANWYSYNPQNHTTPSNELVYIVKMANDHFVKFQIMDYDHGTNTFVLDYALYDANASAFSTSQSTEITHADEEEIYFSFTEGQLEADVAWDVKMCTIYTEVEEGFKVLFPAIVLNREGNVMAKVISEQDFADVDPATVTGMQTDTDDSYVIGSDWFDYDSNSHFVTSKGHTYVVQTHSGQMGKFQIVNYYNESGASGFMKIEYEF